MNQAKISRLTFVSTLLLPYCIIGWALLPLSCSTVPATPIRVIGTWQLLSGTTITKGVASVTDYTKGQKMIKIINDSYFAFLKHDLNSPKDSSNHFDGGGGSYTLI